MKEIERFMKGFNLLIIRPFVIFELKKHTAAA